MLASVAGSATISEDFLNRGEMVAFAELGEHLRLPVL
jgi:hypothetical protein